MSDDWDIDSYRSEYENEDHWELRKNFMLAHKDKFSEDELVCLAQVFTNIEFLGCRYPDKTMMRVAELAKGVVEKFREQRKNSLKRTFVAASDAATAKVKGQICKAEESGPPDKIIKMTLNETKFTSEEINDDDNKLNMLDTRIPKYGGVKTYDIVKNEKLGVINTLDGALGDLVLIIDAGDHPVSTLQTTASLNKCPIRWEYENEGWTRVCRVFLKEELIGSGHGPSSKISKEKAAISGIEKLKEFCYGIQVKSKFFSTTTVDPGSLGSEPKSAAFEKLGEDNIGRKLMLLMGWQGGGLGNKGQGREEPVAAVLNVRRDGLGLKSNTSDMAVFRRKAKDYIRTWMKGDSDQDLVFSSEFSQDERKVMHEVAKSFSLRSKSYGKDAKRHLVISRKSGPWDIVRELKKSGGSSDKYELLYPTKAGLQTAADAVQPCFS